MPTLVSESHAEEAFFSKSDLTKYDNDDCRVYFFTQRQAAILVRLAHYATWPSRWENRDIDTELVEDMLGELMACKDNVVEQLTRIADAMYYNEKGMAQIISESGEANHGEQSNAPFLIAVDLVAALLGVPIASLPIPPIAIVSDIVE